MILVSRIACVCAVAVYSEVGVITACLLHWIGMSTWIIFKSRGVIIFCQSPNRAPHNPYSLKERTLSVLFSSVLGFVYIFIYLNPEDSGTFARHFFYYTICFIENIFASILIVIIPNQIDVWYHYIISTSCIVPFILGIFSMIIYYMKFHPSMKHVKISFIEHLRTL